MHGATRRGRLRARCARCRVLLVPCRVRKVQIVAARVRQLALPVALTILPLALVVEAVQSVRQSHSVPVSWVAWVLAASGWLVLGCSGGWSALSRTPWVGFGQLAKTKCSPLAGESPTVLRVERTLIGDAAQSCLN